METNSKGNYELFENEIVFIIIPKKLLKSHSGAF